jgi:hypothetical protein
LFRWLRSWNITVVLYYIFEYYSGCICVDTNSDWCDNIIQDAYVLIKIPIGVIIFVIFNRS